jgi:hypothetical protein
MIRDEYHEQAAVEVDRGEYIESLWAQAYSRAKGDEKRAYRLYIGWRAEELRHDDQIYEVPEQESPIEPTSSGATKEVRISSAVPVSAKYCDQCGEKPNDGAKYCQNCGVKMAELNNVNLQQPDQVTAVSSNSIQPKAGFDLSNHHVMIRNGFLCGISMLFMLCVDQPYYIQVLFSVQLLTVIVPGILLILGGIAIVSYVVCLLGGSRRYYHAISKAWYIGGIVFFVLGCVSLIT